MNRKLLKAVWAICVIFTWVMIVLSFSLLTMASSPPGERDFEVIIIQNLLSVTNIITALIVGSIITPCCIFLSETDVS